MTGAVSITSNKEVIVVEKEVNPALERLLQTNKLSAAASDAAEAEALEQAILQSRIVVKSMFSTPRC